MNKEKVITIIPAKGHSRRIPGKNKALLLGKPLVQYAIEQALESGICGEICVGTDDEEIAEISCKCGAHVPFFRVGDVDDITSVGEAALNIIRRYRNELHREFNYMCLLLATFPLRTPHDIRECGELLFNNPALDASMSFTAAEKSPYWAWIFKNGIEIMPLFSDKCDLGRCELPREYYVDGAVYWAKTDFYEKVGGNQYRGKVGGYIIPSERSVDIDTPFDLEICEIIMNKRIKSE